MEKNIITIQNDIVAGNTSLGIEFGSTRVKSVLINKENEIIASGSYEWENSLVDGIWTYNEDEIWTALQASYKNLKEMITKKYEVNLTTIGAIGISAMMHGYMVFNQKNELLVPFRTWRNTITEDAANSLTNLFNYPIPQRWSIAHLQQAILNKEKHVNQIAFMTTLAGYVHWKLTGEKVLGVGDASGMFPIDLKTQMFCLNKIKLFNENLMESDFSWKLQDILPTVLVAGEKAGALTNEGAIILDPTGNLQASIPFCPPEGDAGTGMVATNSIREKLGNVSAGTSVFAMIVLEGELKEVHTEIDLVTTPTGKLVAMAHSNNCTTELNAWVGLFEELLENFGCHVDISTMYETLYKKALVGDADCGGLLSYGYHSGEHITHFEEGRPLFVRNPNSNFNLANFMRVNLYTSLGALKIGLEILFNEEHVNLDLMLGHGGFFKTEGVGQKIMADALNVPVSVMDTAGEGGAYGIALLASYMFNKKMDESLDLYLDNYVFNQCKMKYVEPEAQGVAGFEDFMRRYKAGFPIEQAAVTYLK